MSPDPCWVTVLMPVYNGGPHLPEAIESILAQTHREFELLVIDDGSTDGSGAYLDSLADARVRVVHQENAGLVATLNRGIELARHPVVARMDADDVSVPERLERQLAHLREHPSTAAVGSCFEVMDESGHTTDVVHISAGPAYLARQLYFRNTLPHGGTTFRKDAVIEVGGYRDVGPVEDYDLWCRLAARHDLAALDDVLFRYRVTASGVSVNASERQAALLKDRRARLLADQPFPRLTVRDVVRGGGSHVRAHRACRRTAQNYAFDHAWLALLLLRAGRRRQGLALAVGTAGFLLRHPRGVFGLPGFDRLGRLRARLPGPVSRLLG